MRPIEKYISYFQTYGIKKSLQEVIKRILGIEKHDEAIKSLYYYLNYMVDITQLPPTKDGGLRNVQICDSLLLGIFDKICRNHGINYWIDYGTLLGFVRHKGFIPWDDDTDVSMPREDYTRFIGLCKNDFKQFGIEIIEYPGCYGIGYNHKETGIWMDVFPKDKYGITSSFDEEIDVLKKKIYKYKRKYGIPKNVVSPDVLAKRREKIIGPGSADHNILYMGLEFYLPKCVCHDEKWIFPLKRGMYEGVELNIPNDVDAVLSHYYGQKYMNFPQSGLEHHDQGRGPLGTWAKKHNVDMDEVKSYLRKVLEEI